MSEKEETLVSILTIATGLAPTPSVKPEGINKCVVYNRISTNPIARTHDKQSLEKVRFQIDCYGTKLKDSRDLAQQVKTALDMNTTNFNTMWLINDMVTKEVDLNLFRTILEFYVF